MAIKNNNSNLQISNAELLLKDICSIRTASQCTQCSQVAAVTSHRLDNKYTVFGARSRLLDTVDDLVTRAHQIIKYSLSSFLLSENLVFHFSLNSEKMEIVLFFFRKQITKARSKISKYAIFLAPRLLVTLHRTCSLHF